MENWQIGGFGIYVHWPFCAAKCPYCDFNSHVTRHVDHDAYLAAYLAEVDHWAEQTQGRVVSSVFFGGGTPSLMDPNTTARILDRIHDRWTVANDLEITLEANPTSVEAGKFREFVAGGVNRFSVGLQALRDPDLRALGRMHSVAEGLRAYDVARSLCDRVSFDLIYARQDQSLEDWKTELTEALAMAPDHLSMYQLTVEQGTAFGDRANAGRLRGLPDEDLAADMYELTQRLCAEAGLPRYEVSNHARDGAQSRHNLIYWQGGDWLGIGPGAHGRITTPRGRLATSNILLPEPWRDTVSRSGHGQEPQSTLQGIDIAEELLMMGLRLTSGVDRRRLKDLGLDVSEPGYQTCLEQDLIVEDTECLRTTERGTLVLNRVIGALLPLQPAG